MLFWVVKILTWDVAHPSSRSSDSEQNFSSKIPLGQTELRLEHESLSSHSSIFTTRLDGRNIALALSNTSLLDASKIFIVSKAL